MMSTQPQPYNFEIETTNKKIQATLQPLHSKVKAEPLVIKITEIKFMGFQTRITDNNQAVETHYRTDTPMTVKEMATIAKELITHQVSVLEENE
jgi:hypothetical protein